MVVFEADVESRLSSDLQEHAEHLQELVNEGKLDGAVWQHLAAMG